MRAPCFFRDHDGFTLLELMVAAAILSIVIVGSVDLFFFINRSSALVRLSAQYQYSRELFGNYLKDYGDQACRDFQFAGARLPEVASLRAVLNAGPASYPANPLTCAIGTPYPNLFSPRSLATECRSSDAPANLEAKAVLGALPAGIALSIELARDDSFTCRAPTASDPFQTCHAFLKVKPNLTQSVFAGLESRLREDFFGLTLRSAGSDPDRVVSFCRFDLNGENSHRSLLALNPAQSLTAPRETVPYFVQPGGFDTVGLPSFGNAAHFPNSGRYFVSARIGCLASAMAATRPPFLCTLHLVRTIGGGPEEVVSSGSTYARVGDASASVDVDLVVKNTADEAYKFVYEVKVLSNDAADALVAGQRLLSTDPSWTSLRVVSLD